MKVKNIFNNVFKFCSRSKHIYFTLRKNFKLLTPEEYFLNYKNSQLNKSVNISNLEPLIPSK